MTIRQHLRQQVWKLFAAAVALIAVLSLLTIPASRINASGPVLVLIFIFIFMLAFIFGPIFLTFLLRCPRCKGSLLVNGAQLLITLATARLWIELFGRFRQPYNAV